MTIDDHPSQAQIVQQIHSEFYNCHESIISTLNNEIIELSKTEDLERRIEKAEKLRLLGFIQVVDSDIRRSELDKITKVLEEKKRLRDIIIAYKVKYPNYKFITEADVERLCLKYNLLFGPAYRYIGSIPDTNLDEILKFNKLIKDEDISKGDIIDKDLLQSKSNSELLRKFIDLERTSNEIRSYHWNYSHHPNGPLPLEICAPANLMDMKDSKISNCYKVEVSEPVYYPDPVILQPVNEGYLIVTAWGPEASDEIIINPLRN